MFDGRQYVTSGIREVFKMENKGAFFSILN